MKSDTQKAIFKFNNGIGALLCSKCTTIIKTGKDYSELEKLASKGKKYLSPQYCNKCVGREKYIHS